MSFTVYQTNKKTGVVYAYLQTAYRDPETKRPKSKKTYLGRVDPVSKKIVPKETDGKRNRSKLGVLDTNEGNMTNNGDHNSSYIELIESQKQLIENLSSENKRLQNMFNQIRTILETSA